METAGVEVVGWKECWSYAVGEEGIWEEAPGTRMRVTSMVIGKVFPWRYMAAQSTDKMVTRIWLREYSSELGAGVLSAGCADVPVEMGDGLLHATWAVITQCAVLFVDGWTGASR
jgi:hypothetical protein